MASKRCICELCSCGRHRCPHKPTSIGQGDGPCVLTEYNTTYKPHAIVPRESFRPTQAPMAGGEFQDKTTQRTDFKPHPMEKPYVHKNEQYIKPQGTMDGTTSYKQEYTEKQGAPARAIRNEGQRMVPAEFSGEPTYKADYRKWEAAGRQKPYGAQAAWKAPESKFEGQTTFQHDFRRNEIHPRQSFRPSQGPQMSDSPFEDQTSHRVAYVQHNIPPRFRKEPELYKPSSAQFDDTTTFKRDYKGAVGGPSVSFKPDGQAYMSDAPFEDDTTNRRDFKKWQMERPFVHAHEPYRKPEGEMEMNTTNQATYRQMPIERQKAFRPASGRKTSAPFDGTTNYNSDFRKWDGERTKAMKQPDYEPNTAPFEGASTYKGHYVPHAADRTRAIRPDNQAFASDAKFEDGTMYRQDYVRQPIHVCEAALIDQPTSRFRFAEYDQRGHKFYAPVQTSITPLQPRSPMQSQQRLGMSVA